MGTPVDPVPRGVREALSAASDYPGYPTTAGTPALRAAAAGWLARSAGVTVPDTAVLPVIGTKELIAWLPTLLGCGPGDVVVHPELAYPTYDAGARLAGARPVAADGLVALGPEPVRLAWLNSPANPSGRVLPAEHLRKVVSWGRERAPSSRPMSAISGSAGTLSRSRCCTPGCARVRTRGCSRCIRCPSGPTWLGTGRLRDR